MRIGILAVVACLLGVVLGLSATSYELARVDERFEIRARMPDDPLQNQSGTPVAVVVGGETHDLDMIPKDGSKSHVFTIRNDGDGVLQLKRHTVSCGLCVETEFDSGTVAPGETIPVEVTFKAGKPGPLLAESLELRTNDPKRSHITLNLTAFVAEPARLSTDELAIGMLSTESALSIEFQIYGYYAGKMEIAEHEFATGKNREFFAVEFRKMAADEINTEQRARSAIEGTVRIKKGIPAGPLRQSLRMTVQCGDDHEVEMELPIHGSVTGDIYFLPAPGYIKQSNALALGKLARGKGAERTMHLLVKGEHREDVELSIGLVKPEGILHAELGEAKPISNGNILMYPLAIRVAKDAPSVNRLSTAQSKPGKIVIKTTHPSIDELPLFVRFIVE